MILYFVDCLVLAYPGRYMKMSMLSSYLERNSKISTLEQFRAGYNTVKPLMYAKDSAYIHQKTEAGRMSEAGGLDYVTKYSFTSEKKKNCNACSGEAPEFRLCCKKI